MKKIILLFIICLLPVSFLMAGKMLILYFSWPENAELNKDSSASINIVDGEIWGNAKVLAEKIAEIRDADIISIRQNEKYPSDYNKTIDQARNKQRRNFRPTLTTELFIDNYDTVILIYPNWWADMPKALYSMSEKYNFKGKTIAPIHSWRFWYKSHRETNKTLGARGDSY